ncbi:Clp protease ClpP, partial [Escherichia coli]|nr:Clp protease ClpP [Escherichia coli]EFI3781354.1 Clp protease ClpP [Escherichia coli]EFI5280803.1 Clp protease ClpP [Escherichia coli]EFI6933759.1 Clp protease ClpP [Escherichia coli]EFI8353834.1 Clp protease ClpP [Escherichia coli]
VLADQQKYTGPYLCRKRQFCGGRDPPGDAGPCRI